MVNLRQDAKAVRIVRVSSKGNNGKNLAETVMVKIIIVKISVKAILNHLIAIIQRKVFGYLHNVNRAVNVKTVLAQKIMHIGSVLGDILYFNHWQLSRRL